MSVSFQQNSSVDDQTKSARNELLKTWIAAILWLIVIAIESTKYLSSANTSRILYPIVHYLFGVSWENFEPWNHVIRKTGHVVGYGILCILLFRAFRASFEHVRKWTVQLAAMAVVGTAIVASLDEWHQTFLPSRTGRWQDAVLDTSAAVGAQVVIYLWTRCFTAGQVEKS